MHTIWVEATKERVNKMKSLKRISHLHKFLSSSIKTTNREC